RAPGRRFAETQGRRALARPSPRPRAPTLKPAHCSVTVGIRGSAEFPWSRAAKATVSACARHIGAARDREKVYSCSGTANKTVAAFATGESVLSEIAMTGTFRLAASSTILTTSVA